MTTVRRNVLRLTAITAGLAAIATIHRPGDADAANNPHRSPFNPVITRLVARDVTFTISSSPRGPVYSAVDHAGKTLASDLTLDELRTANPALCKQIEPALCNSAADGPAVWAGTDRD